MLKLALLSRGNCDSELYEEAYSRIVMKLGASIRRKKGSLVKGRSLKLRCCHMSWGSR